MQDTRLGIYACVFFPFSIFYFLFLSEASTVLSSSSIIIGK